LICCKRPDHDFDTVYAGVLAHIRLLARVEHVDIRSCRLSLGSAALVGQRHSPQDCFRQLDAQSQATGLIGHERFVPFGQSALGGIGRMQRDGGWAKARGDLRDIIEAIA
jgi:hypothetical protein